jgi:AraC-like DNA-binding protein
MSSFRFDFWDALLLCGVIQGIIMSVLVSATKNRRNIASWFLSATLLIFALHNTLILIHDCHLSYSYPSLKNLPFNLILGFGPCIYFYVFFSLNPTLRPRLFIHFIPVAIQFCYYSLLSIGVNLYIDYGVWKIISQTEQLGALSSVCIYTLMTLKIVNSKSQLGTAAKLKIKKDVLGWFNKLLSAYAILWTMWLVYTLADIFYFNYSLHLRDYFPLYLLVAVLTYWIGIMAYLHPIVIAPDTGNRSFDTLNQDEIKSYLSRLQDVMKQEQLYFDPNLNLKQVASKTGIPVNLISFLINNRLDISFNEWVNSFRIEAVKKQMTGSRFKEITIAGIAGECGFNSKATFNRVFKLQTGMTPREYLTQVNGNK